MSSWTDYYEEITGSVLQDGEITTGTSETGFTNWYSNVDENYFEGFLPFGVQPQHNFMDVIDQWNIFGQSENPIFGDVRKIFPDVTESIGSIASDSVGGLFKGLLSNPMTLAIAAVAIYAFSKR